MKAVKMGDLLDAMIEKYAIKKVNVKQIGLQPGENLHEAIIKGGPDSSKAERYTKDELMRIL